MPLHGMTSRPKLRLSRLRNIGWSLWDPIGLNDFDGKWESVSFADEYDGYLIQAAGMVRRGELDGTIISYLVQCEIEDMGISVSASTHSRAKSTVAAIKADEKIWRHPED